jgi:AcrR family transcriptional regulator
MIDSSEKAVSGLRARKKQQTAADILANAIALFREKGVRGALLSEVARDSHVSPATLFNYFPNKGSLAGAWVRGEIEDVLVKAAQDLGDHGMRSAMRDVCRRLASLGLQKRSIRLEAWREAGRAPSVPLSVRHPIVLAIGREQERERVRGDISAQALGEMLIDAIEGGLIAGLRGQETEAELAKAVQARVDLILDGARKKNERVAAPATRSGARKWIAVKPRAENT